MATQKPYTRSEFVGALKAVGLTRGDLVYVQNCGDRLGPAEGCASDREISAMMVDALREVVGPTGTLLVATYTFSACRREEFDPAHTPAVPGVWSSFGAFMEYFRTLPGAVRSPDPIFAVAGLGPRAQELLARPGNSSLGVDSIHDRLRRAGGKICMIGIGLFESTFRHHLEEMAAVPWRYKKTFTGRVRDDGAVRKVGRVYNVRMLAANGDPAGESLEALARAQGVCRVARVGADEVVAIESQAYYDLGMRELQRDPWFTARGPAGDPVAIEAARVRAPRHDVRLPPNASMTTMIDALWPLPRDLNSSGFDAALSALATQVPMTIHEYPTGTECWSWIVPESWVCHEAYLESLDGRRLFSYADHPLHVVSHSLALEGVVSREELFAHLHVHPRVRDAVPYVFKYYERDWGLCCSQEMKESLTDERYRVVIKSAFSYGTMKVGEVVVPGETDETVVLCSHLCHPAQVNDDMTGVVVGIDVMRALLARPRRRYTYRYLIVPETIGSIAYLSHNEDLIPKIVGGLFLEMMGLDIPHALQLSFDGDTEADRCFRLALARRDPKGWTGPFRKLILNDEVQFNAPGVRRPMLSLSRILRLGDPDWPYPGYHSSADRPERVVPEALAQSRDLVLEMLDTLEQNRVPRNRYKGEVFCSRFGLHIDWYTNREGNLALFDIMHLVDGTRSIAEIAETCGISFASAAQTIQEMARLGVVEDPQGPS